MDGTNLTMLLAFVAIDAVLITLAVPLMLRRVKPNGIYGLRVEATESDEWVWYEANEHAGRDLTVFGVAHLATALLTRFMRVSEDGYALGNGILLILGVLIAAAVGVRRANRLLAQRRAATQG